MTEHPRTFRPVCAARGGHPSVFWTNHPPKNALLDAAPPDACSGCIASRARARVKCSLLRRGRVAACTVVARCSSRWPPTDSSCWPSRGEQMNDVQRNDRHRRSCRACSASITLRRFTRSTSDRNMPSTTTTSCGVACSLSVSAARSTSAVSKGGHRAARACAMSSLSQLAEILRLHIGSYSKATLKLVLMVVMNQRHDTGWSASFERAVHGHF